MAQSHLDEEEAIENYCPFYKEDDSPPKLPTNDQELFNTLLRLKKCPCNKEKCHQWLHKLIVMDIHCKMIKQLYKELNAYLYTMMVTAMMVK